MMTPMIVECFTVVLVSVEPAKRLPRSEEGETSQRDFYRKVSMPHSSWWWKLGTVCGEVEEITGFSRPRV